MKIVLLTILIVVIVNINCRSQTDSSCSLSYYYPLGVPSNAPPTVYSMNSNGVASVNQSSTTTSWAVHTYTNTVQTDPFVVYNLKKGDHSWRVSVINESNTRNFRVKGEMYLKEKTGEQWYTDGKIDENFKESFSRCQQLNKELKANHTFEGKSLGNRIARRLPDNLEKIETKPINPNLKNFNGWSTTNNPTSRPLSSTNSKDTIVNEKSENKINSSSSSSEVKTSEKKIEEINNSPQIKSQLRNQDAERKLSATQNHNNPFTVGGQINISVENKKNLASQNRFLQKRTSVDEYEDDNEFDKFNGESVPDESHGNDEIVKSSDKKIQTEVEDKESANEKINEDHENEHESNVSHNSDDKSDNVDNEESDNNNNENNKYHKDLDDSDGEDSNKDEETSDEDNELLDDEKAIEDTEKPEGILDGEDEENQEEMERDLEYDLNPIGNDNNINEDLL